MKNVNVNSLPERIWNLSGNTTTIEVHGKVKTVPMWFSRERTPEEKQRRKDFYDKLALGVSVFS